MVDGLWQKVLGDYHHLREQNGGKNHKKGMIIFKRKYMKLVGEGMIGNSDYIGTSLNGLILNLPQNS